MGRFLTAMIDAQSAWARPFGAAVQRVVKAIFGPIKPVKTFLNGTWLGHALHPIFTDLAIGGYVIVVVLDLFGEPVAADIVLRVALLATAASIVTGFADFTDTDGRARDQATVHAVLMFLTNALFVASLMLRVTAPVDADRTLAIALAITGVVVLAAGAYVGGELVYRLGNMVSRHAWRSVSDKWVALDVTAVPEGQLTRARAGAQPIVLARTGDRLHALHDTCAHAGCSLAQKGELKGATIVCTCHGSAYKLESGAVVGGPSTFDQPVYEVREAEGRIEVRAVARP